MDGLQMYAVLYSKFSQASQRFLALIENVPKLRNQATLVCIDNRQVRQRITSNPKLSVQEVPCVIRIFADTGYTELFEGEQAFALVKNMMMDMNMTTSPPPGVVSTSSITPVITSAPIPEILTTSLPGPKLPAQMSVKQHMASVEMASAVSPPSPPPNTLPASSSTIEGSQYIQITKTPVFEEIPSKPPTVPPSTSPQISAAYLTEIEKENMQRGIPERSLKSNSGGGSIVTRAQQMQKEREQEMGMQGPPMMRPQ